MAFNSADQPMIVRRLKYKDKIGLQISQSARKGVGMGMAYVLQIKNVFGLLF